MSCENQRELKGIRRKIRGSPKRVPNYGIHQNSPSCLESTRSGSQTTVGGFLRDPVQNFGARLRFGYSSGSHRYMVPSSSDATLIGRKQKENRKKHTGSRC